MRIIPALLCFSIIFSASIAAPLDDYVAARDREIAALRAAYDNPRHEKALTDMKRRLRAIIPAWSAPGFSKEPELNRDTLVSTDIGFEQLDGLLYTKLDGAVVVTTLPLLRQWVARQNTDRKIPVDLDHMVRSEDFFTFAVSNDASANFYGEIAVSAKGRTAAVMLGSYAQDVILDGGPAELIAAVQDGERVFIAHVALKPALKPIPSCQQTMKKILAQSEAAFAVFKASHEQNKSSFQKYLDLQSKADTAYRMCFAHHLRELPNYGAIQKQAQALVGRLH